MVLRTILPGFLLLIALSAITVQGQSRSAGESAIDKGNALVSQGNYEQALNYYRTITPDSSEYAIALYNIGVCHYELWQTDEAIDFYKRAINERQGKYPRASYALGVALEDSGRLAQAKQAYEQTLRFDDNYSPANFHLGVIASNRGDVETAARLFRKALRQTGEHVPASHNNLGVMLARMQRLAEAKKEFALAIALSNGSLLEAEQNLDLCKRLLVRAYNDTNVLRGLRISTVD
jgi:tetratricopeptide (TPR) repeat protein